MTIKNYIFWSLCIVSDMCVIFVVVFVVVDDDLTFSFRTFYLDLAFLQT